MLLGPAANQRKSFPRSQIYCTVRFWSFDLVLKPPVTNPGGMCLTEMSGGLGGMHEHRSLLWMLCTAQFSSCLCFLLSCQLTADSSCNTRGARSFLRHRNQTFQLKDEIWRRWLETDVTTSVLCQFPWDSGSDCVSRIEVNVILSRFDHAEGKIQFCFSPPCLD